VGSQQVNLYYYSLFFISNWWSPIDTIRLMCWCEISSPSYIYRNRNSNRQYAFPVGNVIQGRHMKLSMFCPAWGAVDGGAWYGGGGWGIQAAGWFTPTYYVSPSRPLPGWVWLLPCKPDEQSRLEHTLPDESAVTETGSWRRNTSPAGWAEDYQASGKMWAAFFLLLDFKPARTSLPLTQYIDLYLVRFLGSSGRMDLIAQNSYLRI
jgi:hypothetical protein